MRALRALFLLTGFIALPAVAAAVDPAEALAAARSEIAAKRFAEAIAALEPAVEASDAIADREVRKQALTAVHFYMAVAYSAMDRDDEALDHLATALRETPNLRAVDPKLYDADFVALFNQARADTANSGRFETLYPAFTSHSFAPAEDNRQLGDFSALELLGSPQEKRQWRQVMSTSQRTQFMDAFWASRDRNPGTAQNEFRSEFERRVAFADATFGSPGERGALTDRGRVFTLLGEPAYVRRRALTSRDPITVFHRNSIGIAVGTIEYWFYSREQLDDSVGQPTVTFRFVTHQGIGNHVLQKDGAAMKALAVARD